MKRLLAASLLAASTVVDAGDNICSQFSLRQYDPICVELVWLERQVQIELETKIEYSKLIRSLVRSQADKDKLQEIRQRYVAATIENTKAQEDY